MDSETAFWKQQYKEGKIPQEWLDECAGETLALLEGTTTANCPLWLSPAFFIILTVVLLIFFLFWLGCF